MKNIIYGAGVYGEIFCNELESNDINIEFIVDQYTPKQYLCNKPIKRLNQIATDNVNIFISITSPVTEVEVIKKLKNSGFKNVYSFVDTLHKFPNLVRQCVEFTKTWYSTNKENMLDEDKLEKLSSLLNDDKSLKLLETIKKFRIDLSPETYPLPDLEPQYFPKDIDLFSHLSDIRFVDGGAYIGDTLAESIVEFNKAGKKINYIASFEPDKNNIDKLSREIKKQKKENPEVDFFIYPCGLWSSNEILQFSDNSNSNSSIVNKIDKNLTTIMTVPLDKTIIGATPNYIKMDIEGSEKEAILGAKSLISEYSPVLAICLYHKPQDIWELPLLINDINSNYNMYLRIYGSMGLELVLYCVPRNI